MSSSIIFLQSYQEHCPPLQQEPFQDMGPGRLEESSRLHCLRRTQQDQQAYLTSPYTGTVVAHLHRPPFH